MTENIYCKAKVKNVPEQRQNHGFMVVIRDEKGELWYYGIYSFDTKAQEVAEEIGSGIVLEV